MPSRVVTCEAVLEPDEAQTRFLGAYGEAYGLVTREVYRRCVVGTEQWFAKGARNKDVRTELIARGWSQREATSIHKTAKAAQDSAVESLKLALTQTENNLKAVERKLKRAPASRRHGLARRQDILRNRVAEFTDRLEGERVRVCFGSRRVLRMTREWESNGFETQGTAHDLWARRRAGTIYCEGDKEAISGNASLRVQLNAEGGVGSEDVVSIRVPSFLRGLTAGQERVLIKARGFAAKQGRAALQESVIMKSRRFEWEVSTWVREQMKREWDARVESADPEPGDEPRSPRKHPPKPVCSSAVSVRLSWNEKHGSWYAGATFTVDSKPLRQGRWVGVLGVDINPDHLAWAVVNRDGNPIAAGRIGMALDGSTQQNEDAIGRAVKELFEVWAKFEKSLDGPVPVIRERLDFVRSRQGLRYLPRKLSKPLSAFAYNRVIATVDSRGAREGADVRAVSPAWTSVLGWANYAGTYGLSTDQAAAVVIARRGLGLTTSLRPSVRGRLQELRAAENSKKQASRAHPRACDLRVTHRGLLVEVGKRLREQRRHAAYTDDGLVSRGTSATRTLSLASRSSAPHLHQGKALLDVTNNRIGDAATVSCEALANSQMLVAAEAPRALQLLTSD